MNRSTTLIAGITLVIAAWAAGAPAWAAMPVGRSGGIVTAASGPDRMVVDGRSYPIKPGSAASVAATALRVGQEVDLSFAAQPVGSNATPTVIAIVVRGRATK